MLREATINDVNAIAGIIVNSWQYAYEGIIDPNYPQTLSKEKFINIFNCNIQNNLEKIFVYEINSIVLGFISGKLKSGSYDSEVIGLYVHPDYKGKGIGSKLFKKIKSYFKKNNCKNIIIWTLINAKNNQFYKKHGGVAKEEKEIAIGNRNYSGIGFFFSL